MPPPSGVSRAELLASLSLAVDLGLGLPVEHVLRQTVIAIRLAESAGFDPDDRETAYYASLLGWVGCTADSAELARLFGDDLRIRSASYDTDLAGLPLLRFMVRNAGSGASPLRRLGMLVEILTSDVVERSFAAHCDSAAHLSDRLGLGQRVAVALGQLFGRWDGRGAPNELRAGQLAPAVRVLQIADIVEVHERLGGARAALDVAKERAGGAFDPDLVDCLVANHAEILGSLGESSWDDVIAADPGLGSTMSDDELDDALAVLGDYADLKSPWWAGHSRGVGELAGQAAAELDLPREILRDVRRAGYVHDLGVIGVSNAVWDAPRPLSSAEQERVRTHPYLTARTLARVPTLARIGHLAAQNHERIDGSGYPAGLSGDAIPLPARALAAADVYHALREPRPHRPAHEADAAATVLRDEVRAGRLDGDAVNAVLRVAGHRVRAAGGQPGGLTPREVDVLVLLARGRRNKEIASDLGILAQDRVRPPRARLRQGRRVDPRRRNPLRHAPRVPGPQRSRTAALGRSPDVPPVARPYNEEVRSARAGPPTRRQGVAQEQIGGSTMATYVIERTIPGAGEMTSAEWRDASARSNKVIAELGGGIAWKQSHVTGDKVYCVYEADDPALLRTHGEQGGFPVDAVLEVARTIDPSTAD